MLVSLEYVILFLMVWSAPGDIHHCVDAQGVVQFRDRPCEHGEGPPFSQGAESDQVSTQELNRYRWLQDVRGDDGSQVDDRQATQAQPTLVLPPIELAERPAGSRLLAACSARFFECTNGSSVQMDQCVSRIPACSASRRAQCCHSAFVSRYQRLRVAGIDRHDAVRVALLGEN